MSGIHRDKLRLLGQRLKDARELRGITQQQVAESLQLFKSEVCRYETSRIKPSAKRLRQFCELLNVSSDYLLGLSDSITIDDSMQTRGSFQKYENLNLKNQKLASEVINLLLASQNGDL